MIDFRNIEGLYFVGIGGIGMSALAQYFIEGGYSVAGYDRCKSNITLSLEKNGCSVSYVDNIDTLPEMFSNISMKEKTLVVYTPAIKQDNNILSHFTDNGYIIYKRSEVLGAISSKAESIAISGTHGKTTVTTMVAHLMKQSHVDCSAFLGGISKNYNTNLLTGESRYVVMEADEYDRSFHHIEPKIAVITALDEDHLDYYGAYGSIVEAYNVFINKVSMGGCLFISSKLRNKIKIPDGISCFTYGFEAESDYQPFDIRRIDDCYKFNIRTPEITIENLCTPIPGMINIENFTVAIAVAHMCGVTDEEIRKALLLFQGVKRRFDIRVNNKRIVYIDDYAHHPVEIRTFINAVKEHFEKRKITGIFQPHLYSRTQDFADGFAESLDELDEVILLPVYPAREKPIPGVSSELILEKMKKADAKLLDKTDIPGKLDIRSIDVLLTIGAGDIDTLIEPIEEKIKREML